MDMQGRRELAVTQEQAWEALNDPEVLKLCIPGCDKVEAAGENQYTVGVAVKIGPVSAKFNGRITLADVNPPHSYTLSFEGQGGAAGFGKGTSHLNLAPAPEGAGCVLTYTAQAQVGGKIAQMGQRLVDGVARGMAEDFFKRFDAQMQKRYPPVPAATATATAVRPGSGSAASTPAPAGPAESMAVAAHVPAPMSAPAASGAAATGSRWGWLAAVGAVAVAAWWLTR